MFEDWENYQEDDEALELVKRYRDNLLQNNPVYFDLVEYECIIDYFIDQFNYTDAISAVKSALVHHPFSSSIRLRQIQLLIETGKPAKALGLIRSLESAESANHEVFLVKGLALNLTGKFREAKTNFDLAIRLCPENREDVSYKIAQSFMQIEKNTHAIKYLLLAHYFNPESLMVLYDLAVSYGKMDQPEKSIEYYNKYLDQDPFAEHVWNNLGLIYTAADDIGRAREAFDFATALNPQYYSAYYNKADLYAYNHNLKEAIEVYHDLLMLDPSNTRALCELGNCFEESGKFQDALKAYNQAILVSTDCSDAWFGKGMVHFKQKKYRPAISAYKKAIGYQPTNADFWFMLGEAYSRAKKFDQAIHAYSTATELNPLDFEAWMACAQLHFRIKRLGEAINMLISLYNQNHENPTLNYRLAAYHAYEGDYSNACRYFEKAIKLNYQEHIEMFRQYPKTKAVQGFRNLLNEFLHSGPVYRKIK